MEKLSLTWSPSPALNGVVDSRAVSRTSGAGGVIAPLWSVDDEFAFKRQSTNLPLSKFASLAIARNSRSSFPDVFQVFLVTIACTLTTVFFACWDQLLTSFLVRCFVRR